MAQGRNFVTALMVGTASISMIVAGTTVPVAAQAATGNYRIESQPLSQALMQLSRQANVDIVAPAKITRGRTGKAVAAESVDAALRQMLAGSGLSFKRAGQRYVIQSGNVQGGASQPASAPAKEPASNVVATPPVSARAGTLADARTGAALKGALVEIVETGEKTSTGDLGEFRFPGKNGSFNLRISYLGYPAYEQFVDLRDGRPATGILLSDGGALNEIVVTAYQSARAQALNQERSVDNSTTIISSDLLGQFNGTTIAEAMRRAPGVAFERDENTGDGTNVIVRGLPGEFNLVTVNGQQLPVGSGKGRSSNLGNVLADSVSKITINKTLTAAQDSSGTGALIEIETASPLDRPRRYASVGIEGVKRGKGFGSDHSFAGTLSGRFGANENFGVSISFQRRKQDVNSVGYGLNYDAQPAYLPLDVDGTPMASLDFIDPRMPFPFEASTKEFYPYFLSLSSGSTKNKTDSFNVAAEWQPFQGTNWSVDFLSSSKKSDRISRTAVLSTFGFYVPQQIDALGGETRYARKLFASSVGTSVYVRTDKSSSNVLSFNGDTSFENWNFKYRAGYSASKEVTPIFSVFNFGFNGAAIGVPFNQSFALPEAFDPVTGNLISFTGARTGSAFPKVLLNDEGLQYISSKNFVYNGGSVAASEGQSRIWSGDISAKREFSNSAIKFIDAGVSWKSARSSYVQTNDIAYGAVVDYENPPYYPLITDLGLETEPFGYSSVLGDTSAFSTVSDESIIGLISRLPQLADEGAYIERYITPPTDPLIVREKDISAYIQAKIELGKFDALIGMRFTRVNTRSSFLSGPSILDQNGVPDYEFYNRFVGIVSAEGRQESWLPRILANFRPSENSVIRAGYYSTISRPRLDQLAGRQQITLFMQPVFGPNFDQPQLQVQKPNPDMKASHTHNFDIAFEQYFRSVGAVKIAGFYKIFTNIPESFERRGSESLEGVDLPDDPRFDELPENIFISVMQPYSSPYRARSWGIEVSVERQLDIVLHRLKGFGVYANYTYADSSKVLPQQWFGKPILNDENEIIGRDVENYIVRGVSFDGQPKHSGTLGLTYGRGGIDASLYYTIQDRRRTSYRKFGLHSYDEGSDTLDLRVQYSFDVNNRKVRVYLIGNDLLKGRKDPRVTSTTGGSERAPKFYTGGSFVGGREISAGINVSF